MEDYEWKPPSEAELKVLEARRERMDKISGIMGDYLLKGYKMLSEVCDVCSTILLEDRQRRSYCIACSEVDTMENVKDNPVLSDVAAQRLVEERQASSELTAPSRSTLSEETHHNTAPPLIPRRATTVISSSASMPTAPVTAENMTPCILASRDPGLCRSQQQMVENTSMPPDSTHREQEVVAAMQAVQGKMVWATQELKMCSSVELSIQMCNLIKTCAEAITALNDLRSADAGPECTGRQGRCE
ncbi:protein ZNRD2-like [Dermacentor albipictus]|uniref:protein ZNRD2-like n=1 Tax=Dermacentor albipictus TaxID=60249 RepID=UPI0038FD2EAF